MKVFSVFIASLTLASSFCPSRIANLSRTNLAMRTTADDNDIVTDTSRQEFLKSVSVAGVATAASLLFQEPAFARGRATLEQSYQRYAPRIVAGGQFYNSELRKLIEKSDFEGIKNALQEPPKRKKEDLNKPDAGVAERARQAGGFSDARVLTAADLYAGSFSDNSISPKTKKMQAAIAKVRETVEEMQSTARLALGEESGGLFGLGAKKLSAGEASKKLRQLYVEGGNAWNAYVMAANEELPLQFDRFPFIG